MNILKYILIVFIVLVTFPVGAETAEGVFPRENEGAASPVWRQAPGGALMGVPGVQAGSVVAVLDGGHLKAYSLDGKALWDYYARFRLTPFVSRNREGTCYICRTDGILIAVNRSGRELWQLKTGPITAPVITGWDGRIFVSTETDIRCYTAAGYLLWSKSLDHKITAGPFLAGTGGLTAALENGELLELSPFGGVISRQIGESPAAIIPVQNGTLAFLQKGGIRFFAAASNAPAKAAGNIRGTPVMGISRGNLAAVLLSGGQLVQISPEGKRQWQANTHLANGEARSAADVSMLWDERGIYVFSRQGASGFSGDGKRLWVLKLNGASSIPALSDDGILFSGGSDWILYAYKVENRTRPVKQSLYGPAPEGNYGLANPPPSPWADFYYRFNAAEMAGEMQRLGVLIREGSLGEDEPAYASYLREIAGSSLSPQASETHPPVQIRQRAEAARLLGYIGSRETIPFLADLYAKDTEPVVRAAAAEAIGRIGTDPDGIALRAFSRVITGSRDEQVLMATAAAIGSLCRFSGPPLSESGVKLLGIMERDFMPSAVRAQAKRETASLASP